MSTCDYTINGKCSNCGKCCTNFLPMSNNEVQQIHRYLKKHPEIKEQRIAGAVYDMSCPFRDKTNKVCLIYPVRPEICRRFICNKSEKEILLDRIYCHKNRDEIPMRDVFFNNNEEIRMLKYLLGGLT